MKALHLLILACFVMGILASSSENSRPSRQNFSADKDVEDMEIESSKPPLSKATRHLSMEKNRKGKQVLRSTSFQLNKPSMISRTSAQNKKNKEDVSMMNSIENKLKQTLSFKKTKKTLKRNKAFNNLDYEDWKKHVEPYEKEIKRKDKDKYQQKTISNPFDWKKQQEKRKQSKEHLIGPSRELRIKLKDPLRSRSPGSSSENSPTSSSGSGSGRLRGSPREIPRGSNRGSPLSPNQKGEKRVYLERPFDDLLNQRQSTKLGVCNKPGCTHTNLKCNRRSGGRC